MILHTYPFGVCDEKEIKMDIHMRNGIGSDFIVWLGLLGGWRVQSSLSHSPSVCVFFFSLLSKINIFTVVTVFDVDDILFVTSFVSNCVFNVSTQIFILKICLCRNASFDSSISSVFFFGGFVYILFLVFHFSLSQILVFFFFFFSCPLPLGPKCKRLCASNKC